MLVKHKRRNYPAPLVSFSSVDDLAANAKVERAELYNLIYHLEDAYADHEIANLHTGKVRRISVPNEKLMRIQKTILSGVNVYWSFAPAGHVPHAYIKRRSILTAAKAHPYTRCGFKLDIKDFYPSISELKILDKWWWKGWEELPLEQRELARAIAGLSTRATRSREDSPFDTFLPQGAPTSGLMANIVARPLDVTLHKLARRFDMRVTRYSDDILFTSKYEMPREHLELLLETAQGALEQHDFVPNLSKSRILTPGSRMEVLGVMIDGETPRLSRTKRRKIESEIRGIVKFGLLSHALERHRNPEALYRSLRGYLAFAYPLEKIWASKYIGLLENAVKELYK